MNGKSWDKAFESYESSGKKIRKNISRLKKAGLFEDIGEDSRLLDLFSGSCETLYGLKIKKYKNLYGGDISRDLIAYAEENFPGLNLVVQDSKSPPFKSNQFDFVIVQGGFHHLNNLEEIKDVLKEIKRMLKKDGIFICTEPAKTFVLKIFLTFLKTPFYKFIKYTRYWKMMLDKEKTTYYHWLDNFDIILNILNKEFKTLYLKKGMVTLFFKGKV